VKLKLKIEEGLKKYLAARDIGNHKTWKDLLGSQEAIKDFGTIWEKRGAELRIMLAKIEYDFISENDCSRDEIAAMKTTIGKLSIALQNCDKENQLFLAEQEARKIEK